MPPASASGTSLDSFAATFPFGLDQFQRDACAALEAGEGVLVAAPTGAGKTIVGEFAVHLALESGQRCFYTTPIKALSNQKYTDLVARYGADRVGLLTGDTARNGDAPVVVMTTEVLRNMLYAGPVSRSARRRSTAGLDDLAFVVMDEVHYLADRQRGAVWEEVIIHLPRRVRVVSLSATVSNAEEFADWLVTVRGHTAVIVEEHRPVPLSQHVLVGRTLHDLFVRHDGKKVNPELIRVAREQERPVELRGPGRGRPNRARGSTPSRPDVIDRLDRAGLLPAITFVFSRAGCDAAVTACVRFGLRLTEPDERATIRAHVEARTRDIPEGDLRVLGYWEWLDGLERGIAAHHAGMLPTFKEIVEELFVRGLVRAVFATETLALGINMPARTVVLERLTKWNGETHADITPGEYTQLTGRAGRRGIDVEGHAVVLWQPGLDPIALAGLASTRTYPLRSSFRPSYNMAVNLVGRLGREETRTLLESSFAQFQADRAVVGLAAAIRRNLAALDGYTDSMTCEHGSVAEYDRLRRQISDREAALSREGNSRRRAEAAGALGRLRAGDVVLVPSGRRSGLAIVLDNGVTGTGDDPHPLVLTADRQVKRLSLVDFPVAVEPLGRVRVPRTFNARSPQSRKDLAASLRGISAPTGPGRRDRARSAAADDTELTRLRRALRAHPVHGCAERDDHLRWADRAAKLRRDTDTLERRVAGRTNTVATVFDNVCAVLDDLGYLRGDEVTEAGRSLARVYGEQDLLVVACLREGVWDALSPAGLAAAVSTMVFEQRRDDAAPPRVPPVPALTEALEVTSGIWARLSDVENAHKLGFLRQPDLGFVAVAYAWASGHSLDSVLSDVGDDMPAGDFVRWTRQLIDLLDQIVDVAPEGSPVRGIARDALEAIRRGVIAYSMSV